MVMVEFTPCIFGGFSISNCHIILVRYNDVCEYECVCFTFLYANICPSCHVANMCEMAHANIFNPDAVVAGVTSSGIPQGAFSCLHH